MIIDVISADILLAKERFICQQCNCVALRGDELSDYIGSVHSWANPYSIRPKKNSKCTLRPEIPGTIVELTQCIDDDLMDGAASSPSLLNFMTQWYPGEPNSIDNSYPQDYCDTSANRKLWFQTCLDILDENDYGVVAMPHGIGCGSAGGDWGEYELMLRNCSTHVVLYEMESLNLFSESGK